MHYAYAEVTTVDVEKEVYDLFPHKAWRIDRGSKRILYLLVVDEKEYDFFLTKGRGWAVDENGYARVS